MSQETLEAMLDAWPAEVAALARAALAKMRILAPGATEQVYDNYNATVIAFAASDRRSDAWMSIAVYPRWVTLFFLDGADLPDPTGILVGDGSQVRGVRLKRAERLDDADVRSLIEAQLARHPVGGPGNVVIKSVAKARRGRR
jgi:hypothetical protein